MKHNHNTPTAKKRTIQKEFHLIKKSKIDKIDFKILKTLKNNSKIKLINLAQEIGISSMLAHQRIKKLEKNKIISQYKANINVLKLGRDYYGVKINLKNYLQKNEILQEIYSINEVTTVLYMIGGYDIEFDLEILNTKKYHDIINHLRNKFSTIREIKSFRTIDYHLSNNFLQWNDVVYDNKFRVFVKRRQTQPILRVLFRKNEN